MGQLEWAVTNHLKLSQNLCSHANTSKKEPLCLRNFCFRGLAVASGKCLRLRRNLAALSSSHCTTYRNVRKNLQNPLATIALNFPSQLGKLSPHRRHLADLSFQGRGQRAWKWITASVWWFIMAFPWHQVLSYTDSALLILYTLIDVRELSHKESN